MDLLPELKARLRITHNSEDIILKSMLEDSSYDIKVKCGQYEPENRQARELILERTRYVYNDSLEFFDKNFSSQLSSLALSLALNEIEVDEDAEL